MSSAARTLALAAILAPAAASSAEWAAAPVLWFNADHQTNRTLRPGMPDSQSLGASIDLTLSRRSERSEFSLEPYYYLRRLTPQVEADLNDLRIPARLTFGFERAQLSMGAQYADESTLTTELDTTGAIYPDAARILRAADVSWRFAHSGSKEFNAGANYSDVDYTGGYEGQLYDYRYGTFSAGETLSFSPRLSLSFTGFGSQLRSEQRHSDSSEAGVEVGMQFAWDEATRVSASLGVSRREFDGERSDGRTGSFLFAHDGETRQWRLSLDQSLVPYGTGVLTERDTGELTLVQHFDSRWLTIGRLGISRNEDVMTFSGIDARTYRFADLELRWDVRETWNASIVCGYSDAQDPFVTDRIGGWTLALRTRWAPSRRVLGH